MSFISSFPARALLRLFVSWQDFCTCMSLYGPQIVLLTCLSAVTIYRREMSCNRVFHEAEETEEDHERLDEEEDLPNNSDTSSEDARESETELLLDGAGMYCSGAPLLAMVSILLSRFAGEEEEVKNTWTKDELYQESSSREFVQALTVALWPKSSGLPVVPIHIARSHNNNNSFCNTVSQGQQAGFSQQLPSDVQVHIVSFLHPKEVVALSCVDRSFRDIVDKGETANSIWKALWQRDFAWIVHAWDVGQVAFQRSKQNAAKNKRVGSCIDFDNDILYNKDFYFRFGKAYLDYVLAGQNTASRCLVSIHSNIYDITSFLDQHPGSPDTLLVHSGRDATTFFEDMGHSMGARRIAKRLCVVVDRASTSLNSSNEATCGLHPTEHTNLLSSSAWAHLSLPKKLDGGEVMYSRKQQQQRRRRSSGTLERIRNQYSHEREQAVKLVNSKYESVSKIGQTNVFYDPFCQKWQCWYTDTNLRTVFVLDM